NSHGYAVILCNTDEDLSREERYLQVLYGRRVDGYIIVPTIGSEKNLRDLITSQRSVVLVDRVVPSVKTDAVLVQNIRGSFLVVEHLIIRHGHRDIAIITGPLSLTTGYERLQGYLGACREYNILIHEEWIQEGDFRMGSGYLHCKSLLEKVPRPTA